MRLLICSLPGSIMPKEQLCLGERVPRGASKNAKDKSNSAALLASRGRADVNGGSGGQGSYCSSEKDSGYSDTGSDSLQTDVEDLRSGTRKHWCSAVRGAALHSTRKPISAAADFRELTPIYILKNVVLKQPLTVPPSPDQLLHPQLAWGGAGHSGQAPTQLLLIQQPGVTASTPLQLLKTQPSKGGGGGSKINKGSYLPILNSYPRIAPHPIKKIPEQDKGGSKGSTEGHSLSKRVRVEDRRELVSIPSQILRQHNHPQQESKPLPTPHLHPRAPGSSGATARAQQCMPSPHHSHPPPLSPAPPSPISLEVPVPQQPPRLTCKHNPARHHRFLNTVEILSQSGLLDITMRTQELLRQSAATERDIAQLRYHTQLLCQAAHEGPGAYGTWEKLCRAMVESGWYPALGGCDPSIFGTALGQISPAGKVDESRQSDTVGSVGRSSLGEEAYPPSPLLAPSPDSAQHSPSSPPPQQTTNKGGVEPPDSSTHSGLP
ncbi:CLOCK-interacting pacemaker isoform X2 [Brienomyrus brachyistius]|uniref:CLOCK-interacting pacemaker isoform X2 n=1 Tax=Brienomyrus brachyistius TaxID=42636 RepID=UPI0020B301AB|nr:CLOCK-interacting pacemaker isoform X2 [Brienomyrus brachyistius]